MRRGSALCTRALLAGLLVACASTAPVAVKRVDPLTAQRHLTANALSGARPSAPSEQVLGRLGLLDLFEDDPETTLAELREGLAPEGDQDRVFALAELSYLDGRRRGERDQLLSAAVYAFAFLFPGDAASPPGPLDPRLRVATDLYNRSLAEGLASEDGQEVRLEDGARELPLGRLEIERASPVFTWAGYELHGFRSAADFEVRGLRNRYRQPGIGAPLAARLEPLPAPVERPPGASRLPANLNVPVTALLRIERPREALAEGVVRGRLELYSLDDTHRTSVAGLEVPLEFETTSSLALTLEDPQIWSFERAGFVSGTFRTPFMEEHRDGLRFLRPWRPGRIPVVLVHGTASSPGRWAELVNELENDPRIWERYQIWLFIYNTGNPIALSGALLREALADAVAELDPGGSDPALQRMVVIGHSQGGLLTKLTVVDTGDRLWANVSDEPFDAVRLSPESRDLLQRALFAEPLPFVSRVVFVATPHRGSLLTKLSLAGLRPSALVSRLVKLPGNALQVGAELVSNDPRRALRRIPTSVDNMTPGNAFLETLADLPVDPDVTAHSIIAVQGEGPYEEGDDGVVEYRSARVEGVASELVVRSGHSTQSTPATIEEIRRILLLHADTP